MSVLLKELILVSGLFDPDWYRTFYPDVVDTGLSPVTHYLRIGSKENRHPSCLFDAGFYLSKYPDVAEAGANPLLHYLQFGLSEGCQIRSLKRHRECELISHSGRSSIFNQQSITEYLLMRSDSMHRWECIFHLFNIEPRRVQSEPP
jgi:hypothetical protein